MYSVHVVLRKVKGKKKIKIKEITMRMGMGMRWWSAFQFYINSEIGAK